MTLASYAQLIVYPVLLLVLVKPLGSYMARVYQGEHTFLDFIFKPLERLIYRLCGVNTEEMSWKTYCLALLLFNLLGVGVVYALQRLQGVLPLNPQGFEGVASGLAFNTAISFASNTNWQSYSGETTMSYLTQMLAFTVQNFVSAATGMAVLVAFIRGFARKSAATLGNFFVDLTRGVLYILLPLALVLAILLVSQGVVQTLKPYQQVNLLHDFSTTKGVVISQQTLPLGPAASQVAIKQLGTNGGGFFGVNSAHPFENPTPLSNLLEMVAILLIPAALCYTFGKMVGDTRQGWAILAVMTIIFMGSVALTTWAEQRGNPVLSSMGIDQQASSLQPGGNMEGKELRFGIPNSTLWAVATTAASNGSVNSMHESYMPLGSFAPLLLMELGEVVFGGVGSGLYGMLVFAIIAVFVAGLMVGRTPEYLGKKIQAYEVKMAALVILVPNILVLAGTALALVTNAGQASIFNSGPQGLSEVLYAFSSTSNNNGSSFAGLNTNTPLYNIILGVVMFVARFWLIIFVLAIAGSVAAKTKVPVSLGTLPTHTPLFIGWMVAVVLIVGALSFIPVLALGPIVQQLLLGTGRLF